MIVECWGAGGGGGVHADGEGGGGGGAYSCKVVDYVDGVDTASVTVGAGGAAGVAGGDTSFVYNGGTAVLAKGGGAGAGDLKGAGGAAASGVGTIRFSGGDGSDGLGTSGGGGGSSACPIADGTDCINTATGEFPVRAAGLGPLLGGAGANGGVALMNGDTATGRGGGGGGGGDDANSGSGADGLVMIYYNRHHSVTRFSSGCCCRVLVWLANQHHTSGHPAEVATYADLATLYEAMDLVCDVVLDPESDPWAGDIDAYRLVFLDTPSTDPIWWEKVIGDWQGRFCLVNDNSTAIFPEVFDWINGLTATTGLTAIEFDSNSTPEAGSAEDDPLMEGITEIFNARYSQCSGGTTLSITNVTITWLVRNKVGGIDWVLSADSNHVIDGLASPGNERFAQNLWNVTTI